MIKLIDILSLLPSWETKYYVVKFNDKVLIDNEEIEKHQYDVIESIVPKHNSYDGTSYILITLEPDIYYGL